MPRIIPEQFFVSPMRSPIPMRAPKRRPPMAIGILAILLGGLPLTVSSGASAAPGYLRTPALRGDRLVFAAEGDLWTARGDGSGVRRLTSHAGDEVLPCISPDGAWIAFAGDYDGNRDVFVIPVEGGEPRRLTWHPSFDEPAGWTPDGDGVVFRSTRETPVWPPDIYLVPLQGGEPEKLPIGGALDFSIDPQSGRYAFTRNGGGEPGRGTGEARPTISGWATPHGPTSPA